MSEPSDGAAQQTETETETETKTETENETKTETKTENETASDIETSTPLHETDTANADVETLIQLDYGVSIQNIAALDSYLDNLGDASAYAQRSKSAIDLLQSQTGVDEFEEIGEEVARKYVELGRVIFSELADIRILFKESDEPELLITDIENYFDSLEAEYNRQSNLADANEKLRDYRQELDSHPGESVSDAITAYEERIEHLENALHFLQLKDGECAHCGVQWENISERRRDEVTDELAKLKAIVADELAEPEEFTEEFVESEREQAKSDLQTAKDLKRNIEGERATIERLEQREPTTLDRLVEKYSEE